MLRDMWDAKKDVPLINSGDLYWSSDQIRASAIFGRSSGWGKDVRTILDDIEKHLKRCDFRLDYKKSSDGWFPSLSACQTILFQVNSGEVYHCGLDYHWRYF